MAKCKPTAYIAPYKTGRWGFEATIEWIGKDYWGNEVGRGRTRRDCEKSCREHGYKPVRDN